MTSTLKPLLYRLLLIVAVLSAVYANTLNHGFVWDDTDVIVENPQLQHLSSIPSLFLSEDRIESSTGYYRPLTYVSFAIDRAIWGLNPVGFNVTNLLLHILVALLFYRVAAKLLPDDDAALAAALLFALHPLVGETINFHSGGRNTLLCAAFILLALLCHIRGRRLPAALCFAGAMFSKEFGLLLPAVLVLYDRLIGNERPRLRTYLPYMVPVALYFVLRSLAVEKSGLLASLNTTETVWLAPYLAMTYLKQMFYPFDLRVLYDVQTTVLHAVFSGVGLLVLLFAAYRFRKDPVLPLSAAWFLLFLLPVVNIVHLPAASLVADRYAYVSLMGFVLALAFLLCRAPRRVMIAATLVLCAAYAVVSVQRNGHWKDDHAFYSQMIADAPEMALGYNDLGLLYFKRGDMAAAEKYLTIAGAKKDITPRLLGANASVFWQADRLDLAEKLLLRQLEMEPGNPQPYVMLKMIYERNGNQALAKSYADKAAALFPGIEEMMRQRVVEVCRQAEAMIALRSFDRAENLLREAMIINPDFVPALVDMGGISAEKGDLARAEKYLKRAIALEPSNAAAHFNLAQVYQMQGKQAEAGAALKRAEEAGRRSQGHPAPPR